MMPVLAALALVVLGSLPAAAGHLSTPNRDVTPGAVALIDVAKVCTMAWGQDHRYVSLATKKWVCRAYGLAPFGCPGPDIEIDHLVPRCLGGADDRRNLWPQNRAESQEKDRVEVWACKQVCLPNPRWTLIDLQRWFSEDWRTLYLEMLSHGP